jgi:DNA-directed RNA polymerase specialized sigma24 family protein
MTDKPFTTKELERAQARWRRAVKAHEAARVELTEAIVTAASDGMDQSEVARTLGWPRQRVHDIVARHRRKA